MIGAVIVYMQAGKAEKQFPTHSTADTAHADSTAAVYI
jgi:hypothetical protein